MTIFPSKLSKGDTIALFSPSWWATNDRVQKGAKYLENLGFKVHIPKQVFFKDGQVTGTVEQRCNALYELLENPEIKAIMCIRGGYGALQLLDALNFGRIAKNPKIFIGYSDVTALLNSFYKKSNMVCYHGPMLASTFADKPSQEIDKSFIQTLVEDNKKWDFTDYKNTKLLNSGKGEGILVGGNMTIFDQLIGTPYMPKPKNIILLLEEASNAEINELDKKLLHLKHAGILENVRGIILAGMEELADNEVPFGFSILEIIQNYLPNTIPVITNAPCGHGESILTLPIGANVILDDMKLELLKQK